MTKKEIQREKNTTVLCRMAGIRLIHFQPNKKNPEDHNMDCTIRAICRLLNKDWEEVFQMLSEEAIKLQRMPNYFKCCENVLAKYGYKKCKILNPMTTVAGFIIDHKKGRYFIIADGHAIACINSTIYDTGFKMYDKFVSNRLGFAYYKEGE